MACEEEGEASGGVEMEGEEVEFCLPIRFLYTCRVMISTDFPIFKQFLLVIAAQEKIINTTAFHSPCFKYSTFVKKLYGHPGHMSHEFRPPVFNLDVRFLVSSVHRQQVKQSYRLGSSKQIPIEPVRYQHQEKDEEKGPQKRIAKNMQRGKS